MSSNTAIHKLPWLHKARFAWFALSKLMCSLSVLLLSESWSMTWTFRCELQDSCLLFQEQECTELCVVSAGRFQQFKILSFAALQCTHKPAYGDARFGQNLQWLWSQILCLYRHTSDSLACQPLCLNTFWCKMLCARTRRWQLYTG